MTFGDDGFGSRWAGFGAQAATHTSMEDFRMAVQIDADRNFRQGTGIVTGRTDGLPVGNTFCSFNFSPAHMDTFFNQAEKECARFTGCNTWKFAAQVAALLQRINIGCGCRNSLHALFQDGLVWACFDACVASCTCRQKFELAERARGSQGKVHIFQQFAFNMVSYALTEYTERLFEKGLATLNKRIFLVKGHF